MCYAVIIPTHNRVSYLERALASVFAQTAEAQEIHVVIDEPENREKYIFLQSYPDLLKYYFTGGGAGGSGARNYGLDRVGDVDVVFFLDDDDEWLPEKAIKQIDLLRADEELVGVTCWNYKISDSTKTMIRRLGKKELNQGIKVWNTIGSFSFFGLRWKCDGSELRLTESLEASQDWDYYLRLSSFGMVGVVEEPLVHYHAHDGPKISGDPHRKASALRQILKKNYDYLTFSERALQNARISMIEIEQGGSRLRQIGRLIAGIFHSVRSGNIYFAWKVIKRSLVSFFKKGNSRV